MKRKKLFFIHAFTDLALEKKSQKVSQNFAVFVPENCHLSQKMYRKVPEWPPKNMACMNLVEDVEILLPVKFHWILFSGFREEVENVLANQRLGGGASWFFDLPEKHKLRRGCWDLSSCQMLN